MRSMRSGCRLALVTLLVAAAVRSFADTASNEPATTRMPEVTVTGEQPLNEEQSIGPNQQPEWTAYRRFPFTRIYVLPPWHFEAESGWDATYNKSGGGPPFHLITQEFELGLPHRFQLDYEYAETINDPGFGSTGHRYDGSSFELRWALADWGKLWFNPAVKAEYRLANAQADFYELSLSLGDQLAERWHWGVDFFYEQQVGDIRTTERSVSGALSYTVIDEKLGVGVEMKLKDETDNLDRTSHLVYLVGPSIQWRPTRNTHLDIVPLLGTTWVSPCIETFIFFGIDFGPGSERSEALAPASLRNK